MQQLSVYILVYSITGKKTSLALFLSSYTVNILGVHNYDQNGGNDYFDQY